MINHLTRPTTPAGPDRAAMRATTIAMAPQFSPDADPATARAACEANLNAAALTELDQRRSVARKLTACSHLFPADDAGLLIRTARNHGLTVEALTALDRARG